MPVDLDSSATFGDLLLELAERVGYAKQNAAGAAPTLPDDAERLTKLMKVGNRGYDYFLRANPRWSFQDVPVTITLAPLGDGPVNIDSDPGRYRAPGYVTGPPVSPWTYQDTRTYMQHLRASTASEILGKRQMPTRLTGVPMEAAARVIPTGAGPLGAPRGWEFLFWPFPQYDYRLVATFRVKRHRMVELGERHVAGADHDSAILACMVLAWEEEDSAEDPAKLAEAQAQAAARIAESIELDIQNFPDSVGENSGETPVSGVRLPLVASINGVPIDYGT